MIPDDDPLPRPPLTIEFVFLIALVAPLVHLLWEILFELLRVPLAQSRVGMAALLTYGGAFALCAVRFRQPPARQLGLIPAPASAWLAVVFLVAAVVVSSELDNVVKGLFPPPPPLPPDPTAPHFNEPLLGASGALAYVVALPLGYSLFFCGVLQPLATRTLGVITGVLLTTFLAGFAGAFLPALVLGGLWPLAPKLVDQLILCILRQSSGSLWPVLALDSLWGLAQILAMYKLFGLEGFDSGGAHTPAAWVTGCLALTFVGLVLCRAAARGGETGSSRAASG